MPGLIFNARNEEIIPEIHAIVNERTQRSIPLYQAACVLSQCDKIPISIARANFLKNPDRHPYYRKIVVPDQPLFIDN